MARKPLRRKPPPKKAKKRKKQPASSGKKSVNLFAGLFVLLLLGSLIAFPLLQKRSGSNSSQSPVSSHEPQQPKVPPTFKKEGVLYFIKSTTGDSLRIDIEVAQTEAETTQGLMFRTHINENQGMLFIFDKAEMRSFWMKNTYLPLDIIFVNEQLEIVTIRHNAQPFSRASQASTAEAQYVVEVKGGFCKRHGIEEGDRIAFQIGQS